MQKHAALGIAFFGTALCGTLLATAVAHADALDEIKQRGTLRWGADAEGGGPFVFPQDDNPSQVQGFEVELAELLAQHLGVKAEFVQGQWDKLPALVDRGDIDIVLNGYEWTPTRAASHGATIPYYVYELQMLVRKNDVRFKTLDDLAKPTAGRKNRIAVLSGSAAEDYVRERFGNKIDVVLYDGNTDAMHGVELDIDGVDATLQDLPIVTFYEAQHPKLKRLGEPLAPGYYVIFTREADAALVKALNDAIVESWRDGSFPQILAKYGMWNETQQRRGLLSDERGNFKLAPELAASESTSQSGGGKSFWNRVPLLVRAAGMTVFLSVASMPLAIAAGLLIALGRLYGPKFLGRILALYVEVVRGTPLVLQLYLIFFLLPEIGVSLPAVLAAIIGLAVNYSAYEAEIYRAGLQAIPRGQMEAALSLGMSRWLALRRIIVPQAMRIVIPPVTNDFIALFKDTAVCSVITVVELSKEYYIQARSTGDVVELGIVTAILYLAMSYPLSLYVSRMEKRLASGK